MENDKPLVILSDIDNCFTDSRDWVIQAPKNTGDKVMDRQAWDEYQAKDYLCKPNTTFIQLICHLAKDFPIIFITSREDRKNNREKTIKHIEEFSYGQIKIGDKHKLLMRNEFDYRSALDVKKDILISKVVPFYTPIMSYEDDYENAKMFSDFGIISMLYDIESNTLKSLIKGYDSSNVSTNSMQVTASVV